VGLASEEEAVSKEKITNSNETGKNTYIQMEIYITIHFIRKEVASVYLDSISN